MMFLTFGATFNPEESAILVAMTKVPIVVHASTKSPSPPSLTIFSRCFAISTKSIGRFAHTFPKSSRISRSDLIDLETYVLLKLAIAE